MQNVKLQAQARIGRLTRQKKTLSVELKAVTTSKKEAVQEVHRQYTADVSQLAVQVKDVTRLKDEHLNKANIRHRQAVAKLEEQKIDSRERAKVQRAENKERAAVIAAKNEALELLRSVADVETMKLGRELSAEQLRVAALGFKKTLLAERVHTMFVENELLSDTLETKQHESNDFLRTGLRLVQTWLQSPLNWMRSTKGSESGRSWIGSSGAKQRQNLLC